MHSFFTLVWCSSSIKMKHFLCAAVLTLSIVSSYGQLPNNQNATGQVQPTMNTQGLGNFTLANFKKIFPYIPTIAKQVLDKQGGMKVLISQQHQVLLPYLNEFPPLTDSAKFLKTFESLIPPLMMNKDLSPWINPKYVPLIKAARNQAKVGGKPNPAAFAEAAPQGSTLPPEFRV